MTKIIIMNDVECKMDKSDMIVGSSESPLTEEGVRQTGQISKFLATIQPSFDLMIASNSGRLTKLLHQIRMQVKIKQPKVKYSPMLLERNFGVLNGTKFIGGLNSDLFRHSRICAEGGESVAQCCDRAMKFIRSVVIESGIKSTLCVTHPFLSQIICNSVCNQKQTILTPFWFNKGAMVVSSISGQGFQVVEFWNALEGKKYSQEQVYRDTL